MFDGHKNFSYSLVATAPSPAVSGTTLVVGAGDGAKFPAVPFNATVWPIGSQPTTANAEIVRVTNISTDTLTITRAQESSAARTVIVGDQIAATITSKVITDIEAGAKINPATCQGRLTLTSGVAITTADVASSASVYFTNYKGKSIGLYDGVSAWSIIDFSETTLALGTLTNDLPYDVFGYNNAGTLTLEALAWSSKTVRATALIAQDGILVKTGATARRYLGTFHTTSTTTTADSLTKRLLWNYYNRVKRNLRRLETTASWPYSTATIRQANGSASNQLDVIVGVAEIGLKVRIEALSKNGSADVARSVGIGEDSTTTYMAGQTLMSYANWQQNGQNTYVAHTANIEHYPTVGQHFYSWNEVSTATPTTTWAGVTSTIANEQQSGIFGWIEG